MRLFYEQVVAAADDDLEFFASATTCCLPIFARPGTRAASSGQRRAREIIGWEAAADSRVLRRSVQWHISHPPADPDRISAPMTRPLRAADRRGPLERPLSGCSGRGSAAFGRR